MRPTALFVVPLSLSEFISTHHFSSVRYCAICYCIKEGEKDFSETLERDRKIILSRWDTKSTTQSKSFDNILKFNLCRIKVFFFRLIHYRFQTVVDINWKSSAFSDIVSGVSYIDLLFSNIYPPFLSVLYTSHFIFPRRYHIFLFRRLSYFPKDAVVIDMLRKFA